ncbi:MAG: hypothetical protein HGA38_03665 [Candidatus Moranbacteria bacterium]|nr:hypothetical protein [Candidatus Moranbacteria bacterium]NTW45803.1 hypothetical protein [Candidatus Moranbacteria bacterium]
MPKLLKYGLSTLGVCGIFAIIIVAMLSRGTFGHLVPLSDEDLKTITEVTTQDSNSSIAFRSHSEILRCGPLSLRKTSRISAFVFRGEPISARKTVMYGSLRFGNQADEMMPPLRIPDGANSMYWYECGNTTVSLGSIPDPHIGIGFNF